MDTASDNKGTGATSTPKRNVFSLAHASPAAKRTTKTATAGKDAPSAAGGSSATSTCGACWFDKWDWLVLAIILAQIYYIPFVKIEESFHLNSVFDFLYPPSDPLKVTLPCPSCLRTLLGSLWLSSTVYPLVYLLNYLQATGALLYETVNVQYLSLYLARAALGVWFTVALAYLRSAIRANKQGAFGPQGGASVHCFFTLLTLTQFHYIYYASRPLSNTFALILIMFGYAAWINKNYTRLSLFALLSVSFFRFDYAVLWGAVFLFELCHMRSAQLRSLLLYAVPLGVAVVAANVGLDSFWYGRLVWPEFESFTYNILEGKSALYGTSPVHWYLTNALPRALLSAMPFFVLSLCTHPKLWLRLSLPMLLTVAVYSINGHKELRFLFPVVPIVNMVAALSMSRLWHASYKLVRCPARTLIVLALLCNVLYTGASLYVSSWNYPGGHAMDKLHRIVDKTDRVHVHSDFYTLMTGETPFQRTNAAHWTYSTDKDVKLSDLAQFTHVLTNDPSLYSDKFAIVDEQVGFDHIALPSKWTQLAAALAGTAEPAKWCALVEAFLKSLSAEDVDMRAWRLRDCVVLKPKVFIMQRKGLAK